VVEAHRRHAKWMKRQVVTFGVGVDEDGHRLTFVGGADAEVVHAAGAAEADLAEAVGVVVADPVVRLGASVGWGGFDGGAIGVGWGGAVERTVGPGLVVDVGEGVELGLQLGEGGGGWLGGEPAFQGLLDEPSRLSCRSHTGCSCGVRAA